MIDVSTKTNSCFPNSPEISKEENFVKGKILSKLPEMLPGILCH